MNNFDFPRQLLGKLSVQDVRRLRSLSVTDMSNEHWNTYWVPKLEEAAVKLAVHEAAEIARKKAEAKAKLEAETRYSAILSKPVKTIEDIAIILAHEIHNEADAWSHLRDEEDELTWVAIDGAICTLFIVKNLIALGIIKVGE